MNEIASKLKAYKDWIIIKIIPQDNILEALYSNLFYNESLSNTKKHLSNSNINITAPFISMDNTFTQKTHIPEPNLIESIRLLLLEAEKKKKNVLICIDEISNTSQMASFSSALQLYIGEKLPVFFLGTGIYENIDALKNVRNLTFLYRAPSIDLQPLDFGSIADSYRRIFKISLNDAIQMAKLTKGYSFAYQSLGYIYWNHQPVDHLDAVLPEFDQTLAEGSYNKIWEELSANDKKVAIAIAKHNGDKTIVIRENAGIDSNTFSTYQTRLRQKGLIEKSSYGYISFSLPRFDYFVLMKETGY